MVVVKVAPEVVLTRDGSSPIPGLLNHQVGTVHVGHVPSVSELCELGTGAEGSLAEVVSYGIAVDIETTHGVSDCNNATGPSLVEGLIGVGVGAEGGIEAIIGAVEHLRANDAGHGQ